jgi:hypothetical protein
MQLKLLSAQPATQYYAWQVEVYLTQFLRLGYKAEDIHVVAGYVHDIDESWYKLYHSFPDVEIHFYKYVETDYAPAMQSAVLAQHFDKHPELSECAVFFHDADFLFTRYFDFEPFLEDELWYFSDTISYIGADYIKSKSPAILDMMCSVVNIKRDIVEYYQPNSGGAQKLMKGVTADYWKEVNVHSNNLYTLLKKLAHIKPSDQQYGIQIWTASMWAELWTAWKRGHYVYVPREFNFCWATCHSSRWDELAFFHNAGVTSGGRGMFFKGDFINDLPYGVQLDLSIDHCSHKYYEVVQSVESCLL